MNLSITEKENLAKMAGLLISDIDALEEDLERIHSFISVIENYEIDSSQPPLPFERTAYLSDLRNDTRHRTHIVPENNAPKMKDFYFSIQRTKK